MPPQTPPDTPSADEDLPPPPVRPDPSECCRSNCTPCIFELYEQALERWEHEVAEIQRKRVEERTRQGTK
jgi:hypothetical protein